MGGQEVDIGRREGDPGKPVQAGRRGKRLNYNIKRLNTLNSYS